MTAWIWLTTASRGDSRTLQTRDRARRGCRWGAPGHRLVLDRPGHPLGVRAARFKVVFLACEEALDEMVMLEEGYMATRALRATVGARTAWVWPLMTGL